MPTKWADTQPAPILAACSLLGILSIGLLIVAAYLVGTNLALAAIPFTVAVMVGFLGYGVWKGRSRGSQFAVIVFAIALWAVASNMSALSVIAPMLAQAVALVLALLVTIPRTARAWFSPKQR